MLIALHALLVPMTFLLGSAVGSFLNVCIYRIPWEKSVIWPDSRCPRCLKSIAPRDNLPILGWILLRGRCRSCGLPISIRYPLVEAAVGLLFVAIYVVDVGTRADLLYGNQLVESLTRMGYHQILTALLVAATMIDYDLYVIPDQITVTGMLAGLGLGTWMPSLRLEAAPSTNSWEGFWFGMTGLLAGGALVWFIRIVGGIVFRKEAMGFGDVTLLAMIGSFLGWKAAVLTFFLAPFLGLGHAIGKLLTKLRKLLLRQPSSGSDSELPFGPYLSMAALGLMLSWPWSWPRLVRPFFTTLASVVRYLVGLEV